MSDNAGTSDSDRALQPPGYLRIDAPSWVCPECGRATTGTIDEPYDGDGTCPDHPRQALRLARVPDGGTGAT